jgi:hypothetical protein
MHCALAGIDVEAFKTLRRYRRLPVLSDRLRGKNGFTPTETLALAVFQVMTTQFHLAREQAAGICSQATILAQRWAAIRDTSAKLRTGELPPGSDIMFGRVVLPGGSFKPVCGTSEAIALDNPAAIGIITFSVSRVAATIRSRALSLKIDLDEFWACPTLLKSRRHK